MNTAHSKKGFTIIETLVAISVLLIAVVAPMSIIGRSLAQSAYARDHAIAVNLAQEGIEAVRQKRDSNMLSKWKTGSPAWDDGLELDKLYLLDPRAGTMLTPCEDIFNTCNQFAWLTIRQDTATGLYYQSSTGGGTATKFQRFVFISNNEAFPEVKLITSAVAWKDPINISYLLMIEEYIVGINI